MSSLQDNIIGYVSAALSPREVKVQKYTGGDAAFLNDLFRDVRQPELSVLSLDPASMENILAMQHRAQASAYETQFPGASRLIIGHETGPIGQLLVDDSDPTRLHLVDLALLSSWRRRGIGTAIVQALQSAAAQNARAIHLSVACNNPALALYQRLGFLEADRDAVYIFMVWAPAL